MGVCVSRKLRAFSLMELTIVLLIAGLVVGFGLKMMGTGSLSDTQCYAATKKQLAEVHAAIDRFAFANNRLPRPARRDANNSSAAFGREVAATDLGVIVTQQTDTLHNETVSIGALPFATLGLTPNYAGDCWGNKLTYMVVDNLTSASPFNGYQDDGELGVISLRSNPFAAYEVRGDIAYAVFSHGTDGLGAAKINQDTGVTWCPNNGMMSNLNCAASTVASATSGKNVMAIVDRALSDGKNSGAGYFDDIVNVGTKPVKNYPLSNLYCWGNNSVGQLGNSSSGFDRSAPSVVTLPSATSFAYFSATATGKLHSCGLVEGNAYCWGSGTNGQLGNGSTGNATNAVAVTMPMGISFKQIALGDSSSYALDYNTGSIYCWGNAGFNCGGGGGSVTTPQLLSAGPFKQIASGGQHACAILASSDTAYCWGNRYLGDGTNANSASLRAVDVSALSALDRKFKLIRATEHTCGITMAGNTYCWGTNDNGQLGNAASATSDQQSPVRVDGGYAFVDLALGEKHTCGLLKNGDVYCWGWNVSSAASATPTLVGGSLKFTAIAASGYSTCGRTLEDKLYCWGKGQNGQLGNSATSDSATPVAVTNTGQYPMLMQTLADGAAGSNHHCALADADYSTRLASDGLGFSFLTDNGEIWTPSTNNIYAGSWGIASPAGSWFTATIGGYHAGGSLTPDGTFYGYDGSPGYSSNMGPVATGSYPPLNTAGDIVPLKLVSGGNNYQNIAIDQYNKVWIKESNTWKSPGELYAPLYITSQAFYDSAYVENGIFCAINSYGGTECYITDYTSTPSHSIYGLGNATGTQSRPNPVTGGGIWLQTVITGWSSVTGDFSVCGIKLDHSLWCWGSNDKGQLGIGTSSNFPTGTPQQVGTLKWRSVTAARSGSAAGAMYFCGITLDGDAYCWGDNDYSNPNSCIDAHLGSEDNLYETAPKRVMTNRKWLSLSAGSYTTCGVATNRHVYCWGGRHYKGTACGTAFGPVPASQGF